MTDEDVWRDYRKRPVVIQARGPLRHRVQIHTLEGTLYAEIGDYLIRGVAGEEYPCKPHVFAQTYDLVGP